MYLEEPALAALGRAGRCRWIQRADHVGQDARVMRVVPDACTDVIWNGRELTFAGPDTRSMTHGMRPGEYVIGVRFAPGHGARFGAVPADAMRDARVALADLWGSEAHALADQLASAIDPRGALALLEQAVLRRWSLAKPADRLVDAVVTRIQRDVVEAQPNVASLARELGVSERQLLRRCTAQLGYGPKFLARVLRFQRFTSALRAEPRRGLSELALASGYADQAQLGHAVSELAGTTPGRLKHEFGMSDSDKTQAEPRAHARQHANLQL